jgi:hypothetical protein
MVNRKSRLHRLGHLVGWMLSFGLVLSACSGGPQSGVMSTDDAHRRRFDAGHVADSGQMDAQLDASAVDVGVAPDAASGGMDAAAIDSSGGADVVSTAPDATAAMDAAGTTPDSGGSVDTGSMCTSLTMGDTTTGLNPDNSNGDLLLAQPETLAQAATLESLSFYVTNAAGNLRLGVYSDANGYPGTLLASTGDFATTLGWNTQPVAAPTQLAQGNYWIAYEPSDNNLAFMKSDTGGTSYWVTLPSYGPLLSAFPSGANSTPSHWSFYATLNTCSHCVPQTMCPAGQNCGTASDGCGGTISCGTCASGQFCNASNQCTTPTAGNAPLLHISPNGRYFMDPSNKPFYLIGDTAWALPAGLTLADATSYFQTRASQGFNAVLMDADVELGASPVGAPVRGPADANGNLPFNGNLPGTNTFDVSTVPAAGDTTTTAGKYWQNIDNIIAAAAQSGIEIVFDVYDNYNPWFGGQSSPNSIAKLTAYGQFLGRRYAGFDNIIWMLCNDYSENSGGDASLNAVIQGIRQFDSRHLGWAMDQFGATFDNTGLRSSLQLNSIYEYSAGPWRSLYLSQYNRADFGPIFNIESGYEFNSAIGVTEPDLREEHYSFLLNGATGDMYGNENVWPFAPQWRDWRAALTSQGGHEMSYLATFVSSVRWYDMIPDQNGTVFQGVGAVTDYSGAYTTDGVQALAYQPASGTTSQSFVVNMSHFAAAATVEWFDPTNGTFTGIGSFANTGTQTFNSPTRNSAGQNDFVLVIRTGP